MTRARNRTQGLGNPPLIQLWLEAVLCVFVSLAQGAATTLGMIFNRTHRDWHTETAREALPQATSGIQLKDTRPAATASRMEADKVRVPCVGRGPALREAQTSTSRARIALTRAGQTPACAGDAADRVALPFARIAHPAIRRRRFTRITA